MKVAIAFSVNIDPEAWAEEYGVGLSDVRSNVKEYVQNMVIAQLLELGVHRPDWLDEGGE